MPTNSQLMSVDGLNKAIINPSANGTPSEMLGGGVVATPVASGKAVQGHQMTKAISQLNQARFDEPDTWEQGRFDDSGTIEGHRAPKEVPSGSDNQIISVPEVQAAIAISTATVAGNGAVEKAPQNGDSRKRKRKSPQEVAEDHKRFVTLLNRGMTPRAASEYMGLSLPQYKAHMTKVAENGEWDARNAVESHVAIPFKALDPSLRKVFPTKDGHIMSDADMVEAMQKEGGVFLTRFVPHD